MSTRRLFRDDAHRDAALLKWLRREVNHDLRYWRSEPGALPHYRYHALISDCKAKLALITWAEGWQKVRTPEYFQPGWNTRRPDVRVTLLWQLDMINAAVRRVAAGYSSRAGWRAEWETR